MRRTCLDLVHRLARRDERIVFVGSDLGYKTLDDFRHEISARFLMEGINEAHAVGMAAGMALDGRIVYVNTIATFLTRRCFEQLVVDCCMHNARVRLIGNGGGLVYAPLGSTHLALEDIAILRPLPNMTILAPADAEEMARLVPATVEWPGPIYIRLAKGGDPVVTDPGQEFVIGRGYAMRRGDDALLVTTGIALKLAREAAEALAAEGVQCGILHLPTVKPLDRELLVEMAGPVGAVVTAEEHMLAGGLGSAVAEVLMEHPFARPKRMRRLGIPDRFPDKYGSQDDLMAYFGITAGAMAQAVRELLATN